MPHLPIHTHMNTLESSLGFSIMPRQYHDNSIMLGMQTVWVHYHSVGTTI